MSSQLDLFLTREEVAKLLRVDPQTVSRWTKEGRLPRPLRLGRQLLWRRDTLERLLTPPEEAPP
jgi:excisionase family DNA binding protein